MFPFPRNLFEASGVLFLRHTLQWYLVVKDRVMHVVRLAAEVAADLAHAKLGEPTCTAGPQGLACQ